MKHKINQDSFTLFATILYGAVMLLTFEWYCSDTILTDLSFMNIAGQPFYRMEFASIVFAAAMLIGSIVGSQWRRLSRRLISLSLSVLAVFALLIAFLNVDLFQLLSPTMRISHVTMTVSRILTILLGVSGLCVGLNCGYLQKREIGRGTAVMASGLAVLLSALAVSGAFYQLIYCITSASLFAAAFYVDFAKRDQADLCGTPAKKARGNPAFTLLCASLAALLVLMTPRFLSVTCALPDDIAALITGLLLVAAAALWGKAGASPWTAAGFLLGSILHYAVTHFCSVQTIYSANRIVHETRPAVYLIVFAAAALAAAGNFFLTRRQRSDIK